MTTPAEVAKWMLEELRRSGELYQEDAVWEIQRKFGSEFVYENENGNLAISRQVLKEFKALTPGVVWEPGERMWRKREEGDPEGRRQAEY